MLTNATQIMSATIATSWGTFKRPSEDWRLSTVNTRRRRQH